MQNILVGVDGSPASKNAARWAANVAEQAGATLTQVRAVTANKAATPDFGLLGLPPVQVGVDGIRVRQRQALVGGEPGLVLLAEADRGEVDLIVAGSHVHHVIDGLMPRGVADHLAGYTHRPLLLVPAAAEPRRVRSILLGVSGAIGEAPAVEGVAEMAAVLGAEVTALHVFHRPAEFWVHRDPRSQWAKSRRLLEEVWSEPLRAAGVLGEVRMVDRTDVAACLGEAAHELHCDIVAAGIGRSGPVDLHRLTPVASHLMRHELHQPFLQIPYRADRHLSVTASASGAASPDHRPRSRAEPELLLADEPRDRRSPTGRGPPCPGSACRCGRPQIAP